MRKENSMNAKNWFLGHMVEMTYQMGLGDRLPVRPSGFLAKSIFLSGRHYGGIVLLYEANTCFAPDFRYWHQSWATLSER